MFLKIFVCCSFVGLLCQEFLKQHFTKIPAVIILGMTPLEQWIHLMHPTTVYVHSSLRSNC